MMVPAAVVFVMFVGGVVQQIWKMRARGAHDLYMTPLASGFIAGEALIAVIIPLLVVLGLLSV